MLDVDVVARGAQGQQLFLALAQEVSLELVSVVSHFGNQSGEKLEGPIRPSLLFLKFTEEEYHLALEEDVVVEDDHLVEEDEYFQCLFYLIRVPHQVLQQEFRFMRDLA